MLQSNIIKFIRFIGFQINANLPFIDILTSFTVNLFHHWKDIMKVPILLLSFRSSADGWMSKFEKLTIKAWRKCYINRHILLDCIMLHPVWLRIYSCWPQSLLQEENSSSIDFVFGNFCFRILWSFSILERAYFSNIVERVVHGSWDQTVLYM